MGLTQLAVYLFSCQPSESITIYSLSTFKKPMFQTIFEFVVTLTGPGLASLVVTTLAYCTLPLVFIVAYSLIAILGEMKISAWVQDRLGPMRTGPKGILQPIADILKLLQKEDTTPNASDKLLYRLAPWMIFIGSYAA